ncbi:hypothetical protein SDC9_145671 [bioreactor metagenome]|uniref:Uncharacterized protein n=1 Tax=bioreactor metagenome TaxID=1076179 RepID=A0A645ECJ6_9ZZZZ
MISLLAGESPGNDTDVGCHHKGGIKAHAELADYIHLFIFRIFLTKCQRPALGDDAQVVFQLFGAHATAVIADGKRPIFCVRRDPDMKILAGKLYAVVGKGAKIKLVQRVAGIG